MFGLTFEKLFLVALVAGVLIGPSRLPHYAHRLAELVRSLRAFVETQRTTAEAEMGVTLTRAEWEALDVRQYDPRRIVRQALLDPASTEGPMSTPQATGVAVAAETTVWSDQVWAEAARIRPGQRHLVTGTAAHPRRVLLASLPAEDPRRMAAEPPAPVGVPAVTAPAAPAR